MKTRYGILASLGLSISAYAQDDEGILPFSAINTSRLERPELAEQERELARFILKRTPRRNVSYRCYTDLSEGIKDFRNPRIQYQACKATILLEQEKYIVTIVNQNKNRKDEERNQAGYADFFSLVREQEKNPILIGEDEFLDGKLESGDVNGFSTSIEKILQIYRE